jgi:hypothetical protein
MPGRFAFRRRSAGGDHAYFESLLAISDYWKAYSLRPQAGVTDSSSPYYEDQLASEADGGFVINEYDPFEPPHLEYDAAEDATKLTIPPFIRTNNNNLAADINASDTVLSCTDVTTSFAVGRYIRIDSEFMVITARDTTLDTITVTRAQGGTTAVAHTSGTAVYQLSNSTTSVLTIPLLTNNEATRVFFAWDAKYTSSFVGTGLNNHKAFQISSGGSAIWFEPNNAYSPNEPTVVGSFNPATDVAAFQVRSYTKVIAPPTTGDEPLTPVSDTFAIKPNKWTRYFVLLKIKARDDASAYYDSGADLSAALDSSSTSFTVDTTSQYGVGEVPMFTTQHYIKIDSEIMRLTTVGPAANPRSLQVTRGELGTTAAAHSAGAAVYVVCNVLASAWIADEDREPATHFTDLPMAMHSGDSVPSENSLTDFEYEWNTSNDNIVTRSTWDLVSYHRNWVALKGAAIDPVADGRLVKP